MEEYLKNLMFEYHQYAYLIVFLWCILEGELALILAGILAHEGHVNIAAVIFVAGLGAFTGDQIYFYIGRYNERYIMKKLHKQRRKFAVAHILLKRLGWPIIFLQRYMYGFRTIIPISIGITRYSAKKFAFINIISAWAWAAITILLAWYFGDEIWEILHASGDYWYVAVPVILFLVGGFFYMLKSLEAKILKKRKDRKHEI